MINNTQKLFLQIQKQIDNAQKLNKPINDLVKQQIDLLEKAHDDFVNAAKEKNITSQNNLNFAKLQIKQLSAISYLCKKIGLPTDKYDEKIVQIQKDNLGVWFEYVKKD